MAGKAWRVGLTGGIASGKSTAAAEFSALGVPVIDLDQVAREVVAPGTALLDQVFARFGQDLRRADGSLDRAALRARVFRDPAERRALEALLHPAIHARSEALSAAADGPYQVIVIPLLAEGDAAGRYDRVLLIDADEAHQRARLMARDTMDAAGAEAMLAAQATRAARRAVAHDVVLNDGTTAELRQAIRELHPLYLRLAAGAAARAQ